MNYYTEIIALILFQYNCSIKRHMSWISGLLLVLNFMSAFTPNLFYNYFYPHLDLTLAAVLFHCYFPFHFDLSTLFHLHKALSFNSCLCL